MVDLLYLRPPIINLEPPNLGWSLLLFCKDTSCRGSTAESQKQLRTPATTLVSVSSSRAVPVSPPSTCNWLILARFLASSTYRLSVRSESFAVM